MLVSLSDISYLSWFLPAVGIECHSLHQKVGSFFSALCDCLFGRSIQLHKLHLDIGHDYLRWFILSFKSLWHHLSALCDACMFCVTMAVLYLWYKEIKNALPFPICLNLLFCVVLFLGRFQVWLEALRLRYFFWPSEDLPVWGGPCKVLVHAQLQLRYAGFTITHETSRSVCIVDAIGRRGGSLKGGVCSHFGQ